MTVHPKFGEQFAIKEAEEEMPKGEAGIEAFLSSGILKGIGKKTAKAIVDKFGEDTKMMRCGENKCVATVKVQTSPVFWGWMFQFAGRMQIMQPAQLREEYENRARLILRRRDGSHET
jgi:ATP-dependent exoDNAse (exonuclease V) alpha subunit